MMHDALEGVVQYEIKLLVSHCIDHNYFTLNEYNWRVINFDYGCNENDKPTAIITRDILRSGDKKFHLSSSQALLLCRLLPLIIGDCIPENDLHWKCYLILLKIMDIVSSPILSKGHCSILKLCINEHHSMFKSLNGESSLTAKFHFFATTQNSFYFWDLWYAAGRSDLKVSFSFSKEHLILVILKT